LLKAGKEMKVKAKVSGPGRKLTADVEYREETKIYR
jgi:hypothetical protein